MKATKPIVYASMAEVKDKLLTSNDIVPRVTQPYYHSANNIPPALTEFKYLITEIRAKTSAEINKLGVQRVGTIDNDFSFGTFYHKLIGGLASTYFGMGECGECTVKLAENLIRKGIQDFLFVELGFTNHRQGMETGHFILIINVKNLNDEIKRASTFEALVDSLPGDAIVADTLLGECFSAREPMPQQMRDYIDAYGGRISLDGIYHFFNFTVKALASYQILAVRVLKEVCLNGDIYSQRVLDLKNYIDLGYETRLLSMLKEMLHLEFHGLRDDDYYVYAVALIHHPRDRLEAIKIKTFLPDGVVSFFRDSTAKNEQSILIRKINDPDIAKNINRYYQQSISISR